MLNVFVVGHGKMGKLVVDTLKHDENMNVVMVGDHTNYPQALCMQEHIDIIIDFSHPDNITWLKPFIEKERCAYICGTTGHTAQQEEQVKALGEIVPVVFQANFSLGVAIFQEMLKMVTPLLEDSFDIEVVEKHHNQKQDAPSGTAKMLVNTLNAQHTYKEVHGRNGFVGKRQKEIGIHAIRGGTIAGEHSVYFYGDDEVLEIKHTANSKQIFVNGALRAAKFAVVQKPGLYTMKDIVLQ